MKFLENITLESFKNPVVYSVIGSYFLNNIPLIVGYIFNVSSNPIGESEVFVQEIQFNFGFAFGLFAAQVLGKPVLALLISFIKEFFVRWEKEILNWDILKTYRERYNILKNKIEIF